MLYGQVQHPGAASASSGGGVLHGDGDGDGQSGRAVENNEASDWQGVVQAARNGLAVFASPLASSRWQVRRTLEAFLRGDLSRLVGWLGYMGRIRAALMPPGVVETPGCDGRGIQDGASQMLPRLQSESAQVLYSFRDRPRDVLQLLESFEGVSCAASPMCSTCAVGRGARVSRGFSSWLWRRW